jgi:hypothetical protein
MRFPLLDDFARIFGTENLGKLAGEQKVAGGAIPGDLPNGRVETTSLGVKENPAYAL